MDKKSDQSGSEQDLTDFGFERIAKQQKKQRVAQVFNSVASRYDLMNDLMSLGLHRLWKRFTVECSGVHQGHTVLDLAGGTGDLALQFARLVGSTGKVILADINHAMLSQGRAKLQDQGIIGNLYYVQADAEALPFPDDCFDCVNIAFGLRNVTDKEAALYSMWRVLKPGGCLLVLEFSKPKYSWLSKLYDFYSFQILPQLGQWVAQDRASYRYLAESIRCHPDQERLKQQLQQVGFEQINYFNLNGGIVALHRGYKF